MNGRLREFSPYRHMPHMRQNSRKTKPISNEVYRGNGHTESPLAAAMIREQNPDLKAVSKAGVTA